MKAVAKQSRAWLFAMAFPAFAFSWQSAADPVSPRDVIGQTSIHVASEHDTLIDLAQTYRVGFIELRAANPGMNAWVPGEGTTITLPTMHVVPEGPRRGIVINLADMRLYHFRPGQEAASYPIGIGQEGWETPLGITTVVAKRFNPTWFPPPSIRRERPELPSAIAPGPNNPLGSRALYLGFESYLVHGTNRPAGVGRYISHGCIRMYEEDVRNLYDATEIGTPVAIVYQAVKVGWLDGSLYLEVHPTREQAAEIEDAGVFTPAPELGVLTRILDSGIDMWNVDWDAVGRILKERRGMPVKINYDGESS
jgi:L,D-transpeptidase ErfK/SrfK